MTLYNNVSKSINDVSSKLVKVYPNPVQDYLYIENDDVSFVEIYTMIGQKVNTQAVNNRSLFLGALSNGIYMLKFKDHQNKYITSLKVIKD